MPKNYIEYSFLVLPSDPWEEILLAELQSLPFESFENSEGLLKAYVPEDLYYDSFIDSIDLLNNDKVTITFEKKIIEPQSSEAHDSNLVVRCNLKNEKIYLNTILWIEAMGDYIRIQTPTRKYVILSTMKQFMSRLPEHQFFRTHKSFIVNMDKIERYTPSEVEIAGELLPLSRSRKNEFQIRFSIN